ncbi:unnamed protein product, partial [Anisakis simplex]|uniref:SUZ domain-containing protein n=1 Tax=Anisakis simplex TaxID=6269 RepID=A0A0M3JF80_ANISI
QERQAAYQQARERIFGKFNPDEEVETEADLGPTLVPLPPTTVNSPIAGIVPTPRMPAYSAGTVPIPRPRAPMAALRTIRAPHFQPIPASQGIVYTLPPPMGIYAGAVCPGMGATSQQPQQQQSQPHAYQAPSGMGATGLPLGGQRLPTPHHPIGASAAAAAAAAVHHPVISHPPLPPHAQHMSTSYQPPIALPLGAPSGTTRLPGPPIGQVNATGISAGCPPPPPPPSLVPNSAAAVLTMNCPADPMRTSRAGAAAAGAATQPQSHQPVPFYDARVP